MDEVGGRRPAAAVVGGAAVSAREEVAAVLAAADIDLVPPAADTVIILLDPSDDDWAEINRLGARRVLVTTRPLDADQVLAAVLRGADAVLEAGAPPEMLVRALRVVAAGGTDLSPLLVRLVADALRHHAQEGGPAPRLTRREREILVSIDGGQTVKQTARALGIAPKTVENLQSRLFRKLGVRNRAQAVALARRFGLLALPGEAELLRPKDQA